MWHTGSVNPQDLQRSKSLKSLAIISSASGYLDECLLPFLSQLDSLHVDFRWSTGASKPVGYCSDLWCWRHHHRISEDNFAIIDTNKIDIYFIACKRNCQLIYFHASAIQRSLILPGASWAMRIEINTHAWNKHKGWLTAHDVIYYQMMTFDLGLILEIYCFSKSKGFGIDYCSDWAWKGSF